MKIGYVTTYDSSDIHNWSGAGFYIRRALMNSGFQTVPVRNLRESHGRVTRAKKYFYGKFLSKNYFKDREPGLLKSYAAQVERKLSAIDYDAVFSPGTVPIAYLRIKKPVFFWADATFAGMTGFYPGYDNLCRETIRNGNRMEQLALSNCRLAIYASEWAAKTAIENYEVDPAKVKVVPLGANIECSRNTADIKRIVSGRTLETCKLLFIGVDWFRKGGDVCVKVAELLNRRGIKTELHIAGCQPPGNLPDFVKLHGFVSKTTKAGRNLLDRLFRESHFFFMPSKAECYGLVYAEASSFGLPSLAADVGGVSTVVRDGKNGRLFKLEDEPEKYAEYIHQLISSREAYEQLSLSSFQEYTERLNWTVAGKRVRDLIHNSCG
jgi:glycosyltransferase involved in cell wall biosynthesis